MTARRADVLTVEAAGFLGEDHQVDCLVRSVLPQVLADRQRIGLTTPIRILSLPAAAGQEPYSIAIRLLEDWPQIDRVDVSVAGADIDTRVLEQARQGRYADRALQGVPAGLRRRYFTPEPDGHPVCADLREAVPFEQVDICDPVRMAALRELDVIFCRNLLGRLDDDSARLAADHLYDALRPGGFLFLGRTESLSRISPIFTPRRFADALVYQKPEPGGEARG